MASARRHWFLLTVLVAGATLRGIVQITYLPAILYFDSHGYLDNADELDPTGLRPVGYEALLLRWLLPFGDLALIPAVQHLLGLGMGVGLYALLVRRGVRRWLATLAAAPVLLDGYQLQIEQNVMSDTLFLALMVAGWVLLLWRPRPPPAAAAAAGLVFGLATTVRLVGVVLVAGAAAYAALAAHGRYRAAAAALTLAASALPLVAYGAWYQHVAGDFRVAGGPTKGKVLYGRTAPLADCGRLAAQDLPGYLVRMCPNSPRHSELRQKWYPRYWGPDYFANWGQSPAYRVDYPPGVDTYDAMERFGWRVIRNQPWDVAGAVGRDFLKGFVPVRVDFAGDTPLERWRFQERYPDFPRRDEAAAVAEYGGAGPAVRPGLAAFLRDYQAVGYTSGAVFAAGYLAALAAAAGLGRARGSGLRHAALLVALTGVSLTLVAATFEFSWRYQLPSVVLAPLAGALGFAALFASRRDGRPMLLSRGDGAGTRVGVRRRWRRR